ncbi:MAG: hypothetical protein KGP14_10255 [Betaproteobacteria bacterium]|nr:hypothetical protein [Betaproteobacteria bacterium]
MRRFWRKVRSHDGLCGWWRRLMTVAVLFARADSHYKALTGVDVWDAERDARRWPGGCPVVAHPPCRAWGQLRALANPRPDEKALAIYAVEQVRKFGGVLEHPKNSTLWPTLGLPRPGERDEFGGWTLPIYQRWWGHRAEKPTLLYIVGCAPADVPPMPLALGEAHYICGSSGRLAAATRREFYRSLVRGATFQQPNPQEPPAASLDLARERCIEAQPKRGHVAPQNP